MSDPSNVKGFEWEVDLPSLKDLTPLTQSLITPELAFAFGLNPEPPRPMIDLNVAVHTTCSTNCPKDDNLKRVYTCEPNESNSGSKDDIGDEFGLNRALKRPRLVWTPQLHKRFVDVIEHLGVDKAVPKTIMEMMSVEGLTRENVASHLQKYRLYMKRMDGFSGGVHLGSRRAPSLLECEGFTIEPQPQQSVHCSGLPLMPMPVVGPPSGSYGLGHLGLPVGNSACGVEYGEYNFWNRH